MDDLLFEGMKYGIVLFGLIMAYAEFSQAKELTRIKRLEINVKGKSYINYIWVKWGLGIMGAYWAFYYTKSILNIGTPAHQVWVRGPLFITIILVACGALMSLRRNR
jgi:hypothetical protein